MAHRRSAGSWVRTAARRFAQGRIRRRLVDGFRLFSQPPLVGRLGPSGRGGQIRLGAAACRRGAARRARRVSGFRIRARPSLVVAGAVAHFRPRVWPRGRGMGARPPVHRLSVERPRHGARRQSRARPDCFPRRLARAHVPDDRDLRRPRDAMAGEREPAQSHARRSSPRSRLRSSPLSASSGSWRRRAPRCPA